MKIFFDVKHLYYLPQYLPLLKELSQRQIICEFIFYQQEDEQLNQVVKNVISNENLTAHIMLSWGQARDFYVEHKPDWLIISNTIDDVDKIHSVTKTAMMGHGIGPKSCYYQISKSIPSVMFVEGQHRLKRMQDLYPDSEFIDSGYAKLDPIFNEQPMDLTLYDLGLDKSKKTLLYAPTFYPSSLECFAEKFPLEFKNYNIILKPHFFSITKSKYQKQHNLLKLWQQYDNVYLAPSEDYNLLPFMALADVMISDASSAMFEFAALNKPVIWCDFYKLRWGYRGIFSFRFKKRLDSDIEFFHELSDRVGSYKELSSVVKSVLADPAKKEHKRIKLTEKLAGKTDGNCSARIVDYLNNN